MNRPIHFEIPSDNLEQAKKFYGDIFGWQFQPYAEGPYEYWLINTGDSIPGIDGGLMQRRDPQQPSVVTIQVEDLDGTIARIEKAGGSICVPRMPIPGVGYLAYFKDIDGHIFGIMQEDKDAK